MPHTLSSPLMVIDQNYKIYKANLALAKKTQIDIKKLSGKKHYIYTSIYKSKNKKKIWSHTEKTTVIVRKLKNKEMHS